MLDDTLEIPALRRAQFREDETTLIEVLRPGRARRARVPPKAYATTEVTLPSVIVQPDPVTLTATRPMIPRVRVATQRMHLRDFETSPVLGPRTSGVLLGALAVVIGVAMLKVVPLLGPLFDAMMH
jgi:hypothetical protein